MPCRVERGLCNGLTPHRGSTIGRLQAVTVSVLCSDAKDDTESLTQHLAMLVAGTDSFCHTGVSNQSYLSTHPLLPALDLLTGANWKASFRMLQFCSNYAARRKSLAAGCVTA